MSRVAQRARAVSRAAPRTTTIGEVYRKVVGVLQGEQLVYGQSTLDASDEASLLVARSLTKPLPLEGRIFDEKISSFIDRSLQKAFLQPITAIEAERILSRTERRVSERLPAAYIVGEAYQQGCLFKVTKDVIIPRSYIGEVLRDIPKIESNTSVLDHKKVKRVLELCTGSACLSILALRFLPSIEQIDAVDICPKALDVARQNVKLHGLDSRINLHLGDLYGPCTGGEKKEYDLIIANPPYVRSDLVKKLPREYKHEPSVALEGGEDGLAIVDRILLGARDHLSNDGRLLLEIGTGFEQFKDKYRALSSLVTWVETSDSTHELLLASKKELKKVTPRVSINKSHTRKDSVY